VDQQSLTAPAQIAVLDAGTADVGRSRERARLRRLRIVAVVLGAPACYLWFRIFAGDPVTGISLPTLDPFLVTIVVFFAILLAVTVGTTVAAGRSPHVLYRPEQIDIGLDDVVGIEGVKEDAIRSINLFLSHRSFRAEMGGTPRRGLLFEGAPGTGKTHLAKAMAQEAGVPFLFVSATSFQSMYYGATARKIRSYFKALRKAARSEGGAIGFIEEIDAIAMARGGLRATGMPSQAHGVAHGCGGMSGLPFAFASGAAASGQAQINASITSEGTGGVVNELLVQMQSFDDPTGMAKLRSWVTNKINLVLPAHRQLSLPTTVPTNLLLIAATNRADNLDPALLRPGRFDRRLTFELPAKRDRRALIDHFLDRKAHRGELDLEDRRDQLAAVTQGYTPVMIEHLFDEGLINAVRRGARAMSWQDVERARLVEDVGMGQPVAYTDHEKHLIATHEAGHATVAWLVAPHRRLEVLTIIKRRDALGLLAHGDREDVFTRSKSELTALIQIAFGGHCAEQLFFDDVSTGPGGDLAYATSVAAQMVGSCGMLGSLVSFAAVQHGGLSDTNLVGRVLADGQARLQVEETLQAQRTMVTELLNQHRYLVEALRDALVERHELVGEEITDILEAAEAVHGRVIDLRDGRRLAQ
jgi:ATP-dependent Zn protease